MATLDEDLVQYCITQSRLRGLKLSATAIRSHLQRRVDKQNQRKAGHVTPKDKYETTFGTACLVCGMPLDNGDDIIVRTDVHREIFGKTKPVRLHRSCNGVSTSELYCMTQPTERWPRYY